MTDLEDFELGATGDPGAPEPPRRGPAAWWIGAAVLLVALIAGVAYLAFRRRPAPAAAPPRALPQAATPSAYPSASPGGLPALEASDAYVRELAKGLSSHPQLGLWLAARDLVRTFTVVVDNVAEGGSPSQHLRFLTPNEPFTVLERQGRTLVDAKTYARYDAFAEGVASLDAAGCGRLYREIEPLLEAAYRELGYPQGGFTNRLAEAVALLLATPVVDGDVPVRPALRGAVRVYEYAEPRLESLTPAQKHLLRMGPQNVRRAQAKLRELQQALGLPGAS